MKNTESQEPFCIVTAESAGFCMGVKNAFNQALKIAKKFSNTAILGDIVHNRFAVKEIQNCGLSVLENLPEILQNPKIKNVIIRAHGITPKVQHLLEASGKKVFDLTCPIVKKVQLLTQTLSNEAHDIIIFGKKDHPEVLGIAGYCSTQFVIVSSQEEATIIPASLSAPVLISQTTMNSDQFMEIQKILQKVYPKLEIRNTLCRNPQRTQENALKLAEQADLILVIGDKKSSNTHSLYERIRQRVPALFIEDRNEITEELFPRSIKTVGVTAGCSTPDFQISSVIKKLQEIRKKLL